MNTKTPEERAAERFDREASYIELHRGEGYATCIREEVEPLEAEVAKLRALVQKAVDAIDNWQNGPWIGKETAMHYARGGVSIGDFNRIAKQHGFVPTKTTEG